MYKKLRIITNIDCWVPCLSELQIMEAYEYSIHEFLPHASNFLKQWFCTFKLKPKLWFTMYILNTKIFELYFVCALPFNFLDIEVILVIFFGVWYFRSYIFLLGTSTWF